MVHNVFPVAINFFSLFSFLQPLWCYSLSSWGSLLFPTVDPCAHVILSFITNLLLPTLFNAYVWILSSQLTEHFSKGHFLPSLPLAQTTLELCIVRSRFGLYASILEPVTVCHYFYVTLFECKSFVMDHLLCFCLSYPVSVKHIVYHVSNHLLDGWINVP